MNAITLKGATAAISPCGAYRYRLTRGDGRRLAFVMLNPSTANAEIDDPTIRRCKAFALREGYDGIEVVNLYAYRATDPDALLQAADPIGPSNMGEIQRLAWDYRGGWIVCAWGALSRRHMPHVARVAELLKLHDAELVCLGKTKDGAPRHPLYVRGDASIESWSPPA